MAWPSYDRTTWGLIIAIGALVLAFPLSLAANLVTPAIRIWWASRSTASIKKRIDVLEKKLAQVEATPLYSHFELVAMRGIARTGWLVVSSVELILLIALSAVVVFEIKSGEQIPRFLMLCFLTLYGVTLIKNNVARLRFHEAVIEGTVEGRVEMKQSIAKLKEILARKSPASRAFQ